MGFTRIVVPEANASKDDVPPGCQLAPVKNVGEALDHLMEW
jgi:hypothetical protein